MKILYVANMRFPTEMAHGVQVAKSCEAFAAAGHAVTLIVPDRYTPVTESAEAYYGLKTPFSIRTLNVPDTVRKWGRFGFIVQIISFAFAVMRYIEQVKPDVVYCRDEHVLAIALFLGARKVVWESHDGAWNLAARFVAKRSKRMVVVTEGQREIYLERSVPPEKIIAIPNGIDIEETKESKTSSRLRLGLPLDAFIVLYAGAFGGWKGTDTLFAASELLSEHIRVAVIGGRKEQVEVAKKRYPHILFLGERPYRELLDNLASADACVLPNTAQDAVSVRFTSPLKLLAYMAAGKPIVASDLPSVRELVGEDSALLVTPDDPSALAQGIEELAQDVTLCKRLGVHARARSLAYSWSSRAKRVLDFITSSRTPLLAIYRGKLDENRGTPIRVRSFLERLAYDERFVLTVASWDEILPFPVAHIRLTNRKFDDIRVLSHATQKGTIVLGHTMATWYYLALLKIFRGAKIVLEMHGFLEVEARFYGSINVLQYYFERYVYSLFYPFCNLITTCSENAAEILARYNRHVVPIYGGVDIDMFHPDVAPLASIRKERGTILIGYAGNTRKWQGVPFLIDAFKKLHAEDPSFRLAVLSSEAKNIPSEKGVDVYGQVPHGEVPAFLATCDILVIPRLNDAVSRISFPSKLPEYMAMGKPVIASTTSDADRIIVDGENGRLFAPGDTQGFISCVLSLKTSEARLRVGMKARTTAATRLSWPLQVAILADTLDSIKPTYVKG